VSFERVTPDVVRTRPFAYRIVDVREPHELEGPLGRIEGADAIPLGEVESRADELLGERPVLFVCRSGKRSASACEMLERRSGRSANLEGGIIAWQRAGLPVERTARESGSAILESLSVWLAQVTGQPAASGRAAVESMLRAAKPDRPNGATDGNAAAGASSLGKGPTQRAVLAVLDALEARLRESGPPADHDLAFAAFRRDAVALSGE
jgi:rhodanese-related sulfurtransferase